MKNSKVRFSHAELERIAEWEMEHHGVIENVKNVREGLENCGKGLSEILCDINNKAIYGKNEGQKRCNRRI